MTKRLSLLIAASLLLAGCGPKLPPGVDAGKLDAAVSDAIGDPNTCVLIGARGSGAVAWRYNTHTTCARKLAACDRPEAQTVDDLLKATAADGKPRRLSCLNHGWASGDAGHGLVYAAVMDGSRALPGLIMAEKLEGAMKDAGL
jgi:hypothetical protein